MPFSTQPRKPEVLKLGVATLLRVAKLEKGVTNFRKIEKFGHFLTKMFELSESRVSWDISRFRNIASKKFENPCSKQIFFLNNEKLPF